MIRLIEPNDRYLKSYMEAYAEYENNQITAYSFTDTKECNVLEKFENYRNEHNLKPGRVGAHYFWLVDDSKEYFLGEIAIRHRLNEALSRYGGHIGYGVRFSEWNKGYGTYMLKLAVEEAKKMGLSSILITCDDDNIGSAKVLENNGFVLQDKITNHFDCKPFITRRYWKTL